MRSLVRRSLHAAVALSALLAAPSVASAATLYVATNGADGGSCTQAAPCKSFARAYNVATAGSDVIVAAGSYAQQDLSGLAPKATTELITFKPAAGAAVELAYLNINNARNIEVRDMQATWQVRGNAKHIVLRNIKILHDNFGGYLGGADDVQILGGEIGFIDPNDGLHFNNADGPNSNVLIDGLFMHDLTRNNGPDTHTDCVQTTSSTCSSRAMASA